MKQATITLTRGDDKKHSVVYRNLDLDAFVSSVYIKRTALPNPVPQTVSLTLTFDDSKVATVGA